MYCKMTSPNTIFLTNFFCIHLFLSCCNTYCGHQKLKCTRTLWSKYISSFLTHYIFDVIFRSSLILFFICKRKRLFRIILWSHFLYLDVVILIKATRCLSTTNRYIQTFSFTFYKQIKYYPDKNFFYILPTLGTKASYSHLKRVAQDTPFCCPQLLWLFRHPPFPLGK